MPGPSASNTTLDMLFDGRLTVHQPRHGYRFSVDAVLLAHQVQPQPDETVLDLGTGCGIVPLVLCYRHPRISVWAVEVQAPLAELACRNVHDNQMQDRIFVQHADLCSLESVPLPPSFDRVVTNPPYRRINSGRLNPDGQRAAARHEVKARLGDVLLCARRRLRNGGRFTAVYTTERLPELMTAMQTYGITPKYLRMVHTRQHFDAKRVLIEGVKGAKSGLTVGAPLVVHEADGSYSREVNAMFRP